MQAQEIIQQLNSLKDQVARLKALDTPPTGSIVGSGTSFPASPATYQRYFRTDRGLEYYFDGTHWLSPKIWLPLTSRGAVMPFAQSTTFFDAVVPNPSTGGGILITDLCAEVRCNSVTQSSTNYYTISLVVTNGATSPATTLSGTTDTKTFANAHTSLVPTVTPAVYDTSYFMAEATMTPTGNPGTFIFFATIGYRLIGL